MSTGAEPAGMCLVACPGCHAQFDTTGVRGESFLCHCGARVPNVRPTGVDAPVRRCSACGAGVDGGATQCTYCGSVIAAGSGRLICPECFARNQGQAKFCASCGVAFQPQPVIATGDPVPCPVCTSDLSPRSLAGLAVQECATCRGLWVPAANFDALVAHAQAKNEPHPTDGLHATPATRAQPSMAVTYRHCPVCRQIMNRKNFGRMSGVIVDWCRADGTWLDADELAQIAAFVAGGGMARVAAAEKEEERAAASMRALDGILRTPSASDGHPITLVDVLTGIFK